MDLGNLNEDELAGLARGNGQALYLISGGSAAINHIDKLIILAKRCGWDVHLVLTKMARKMLRKFGEDRINELSELTNKPVVTKWTEDFKPIFVRPAQAAIVAPITLKSFNRWASQTGGGLVPSFLNEIAHLGIPVATMPTVTTALADGLAYQENKKRLAQQHVGIVEILVTPGGSHDYADLDWREPLRELQRVIDHRERHVAELRRLSEQQLSGITPNDLQTSLPPLSPRQGHKWPLPARPPDGWQRRI